MAVADDTAQAVRTQEVDYLRMGMSDLNCIGGGLVLVEWFESL